MEIIHLIRQMSRDNVTWGAPKIASELAHLGFRVAESTVAKYMVKRPNKPPSQTWKAFLRNHVDVTAACDFFVVPTATFKFLYCFVVLSLDRRRIVHVNVTSHPSAEWTARQILEALSGDEAVPRFLMRDRDAIYGWGFHRMIRMLEIDEVISAPRSPWQNGFVERVIGSIRRECTDHVIAFGERHLLRLLREYVAYYNESRCHMSLDGNAPVPRAVELEGAIISTPVLGGLHHRYSRSAA